MISILNSNVKSTSFWHHLLCILSTRPKSRVVYKKNMSVAYIIMIKIKLSDLYEATFLRYTLSTRRNKETWLSVKKQSTEIHGRSLEYGAMIKIRRRQREEENIAGGNNNGKQTQYEHNMATDEHEQCFISPAVLLVTLTFPINVAPRLVLTPRASVSTRVKLTTWTLFLTKFPIFLVLK